MNIFQEFIKCQTDFSYFTSKYVKIHHPVRGIIPYDLYDFHKRLHEFHDKFRYIIVKKFRQGGFTTFSVIRGLWECLFYDDQSIFFVSRTQRDAQYLDSILQQAIFHLPDEFKALIRLEKLVAHHQNRIFPCTRSKIYFGTPQEGRSRSVTHLILDEAAFISDMHSKWKVLCPCVGDEGKISVISTINGYGWFGELCRRAEDGMNNFRIFKCHYSEHPDFQKPEVIEELKRNLGETGWKQEMEGNFLCETSSLDFKKYQIQQILDRNDLDDEQMCKLIRKLI